MRTDIDDFSDFRGMGPIVSKGFAFDYVSLVPSSISQILLHTTRYCTRLTGRSIGPAKNMQATGFCNSNRLDLGKGKPDHIVGKLVHNNGTGDHIKAPLGSGRRLPEKTDTFFTLVDYDDLTAFSNGGLDQI